MSSTEEIHSCGYHCDNPLCIRRQRDFLAEQTAAQAAEIERLKQAVLDEREACARTASEHACYGHNGHRIAKEIRARGEVK